MAEGKDARVEPSPLESDASLFRAGGRVMGMTGGRLWIMAGAEAV